MKPKNLFNGKPVTVGDPNVKVIYGFMLGAEHAGIVTMSTFEGREAVDFRRFYFDEVADAWKPSVKGLRIPPIEAGNIARALIHHSQEKST